MTLETQDARSFPRGWVNITILRSWRNDKKMKYGNGHDDGLQCHICRSLYVGESWSVPIPLGREAMLGLS